MTQADPSQEATLPSGGEWFFALDNQQRGPVGIEDVRSMLIQGTLGPESLVWTAGMTEWSSAAMVAELADIFARNAGPRQLQYGLTPAHYVTALGVQYATFWERFVGLLIDSLLVQFGGQMLQGGIWAVFSLLELNRLGRGQKMMLSMTSATTICVGWLYYALMESSRHQGTLGKIVMKLAVTDRQGQPITFGRATGRYFGRLVSQMICLIGYFMAAWTEKRQALHDIMAGTLVIKKPR